MRRLALICSLALVATLMVPLGAGARLPDLPLDARCAEGSLTMAATEVFGTGTEVVARQTVAGLPGALVLEPRIAPGTRGRLLRVGRSWCEASSSFNLAWKAAGGSFDPAGREAAARAYAQLAAAPYFDDVTITGTRRTSPTSYGLTTHARTNGVEARWAIVVDSEGIKTAKWTATAFAQRPFHAETEGLTALPGGTETYARVDRLLVAARGLPTAEAARMAAAPGLAEYVSPDKFTIAVSVGDTRVAVDPGMDTGVRKADVIRENLRAIELNYEDFYRWGLRKGWGELEPVSGPDKGYVYINDALSFFCFACVFIADDFQIHMMSEVELVLNQLGYSYPEGVEAYQNIIGHEMFHNFQNRYNKPGPLLRGGDRRASFAYMEGTARAQESMHGYSKVSFQKNSLIYAEDANGCNGWATGSFDQSMARGVFTGNTYAVCYFWLPWFAAEGTDGVKTLLAEAYPKVSPKPDGGGEVVAALKRASHLSVEEQIARFVGSSITGRGYVIGGRDWGRFMDRWRPLDLEAGDEATATLQTGGLFGRRLVDPATVTLDSSSKATLFVVIDTGSKTLTKVVDGRRICLAPEPGQKIYVGAIHTRDGSDSASITASQPTCR